MVNAYNKFPKVTPLRAVVPWDAAQDAAPLGKALSRLMNKKIVVGVTNLIASLVSFPLPFWALVYGLHAPNETPSMWEKFAFAGPLILFSISLWVSGFLYKEQRLLSILSSLVAFLVILYMILAVTGTV